MNNNEPPQKNPPTLGKNKHFWHFWNNARHTKNKPFNIKTLQKNKPPKKHFAMFKNNPLFFHKFSVFQHTVFVFENLCFPENTIKIVFSGEQRFSKRQLVKPTFSTMSKNTIFPKKVSFLVFFCNFRWNPYFYSVSCFALFWSKIKFWPKQIVATKMRVFSPFLTQIVSGNFC